MRLHLTYVWGRGVLHGNARFMTLCMYISAVERVLTPQATEDVRDL